MSRFFSKCRTQKSKLALLCVLIAAVSCLISIGFSAEAAGSRNLTATKTGTTWASNTGYRPYIEWNNASTAGIVRHQIIKVYAYAGEKLYFGSSVSAGVDGDIAVRKPDGTAVAASLLDVNAATGAGYINTRAKELAGPICPGGDTTGTGYTPLSLTVDQTGIWEFEFHSVDPTNSNDNPTPALNTQAALSAGGVGVAAWDVTVVKNNSQIVTGRVFTNFLSLNMGLNSDGNDVLNGSVYVLTKDGYVYQTNFNGMDPYGFVFYANNRGLVRADANTSLYQSGVSSDNSMTTILSNGISAQFQSPNNPDTALDSTYKIFFEQPSADLPADIYPTAYAPGTITDFTFTGDSAGHGFVGSGGYFSFTANKVSSFQIVLDLSKYKNADGTTTDRGIVYLANSCVEGTNRIFWDGKDGNGNIVPAGTYGGPDSGVSISIVAKAGEYHFPMYDVENNRNGVTIKLLSNPLDSNNQPMTLTAAERVTVHYNNNYVPLIAQEDSRTGRISNQISGIDSTTGASRFGTSSPYRAGDFSALDIWAYYTGGASHLPVSASPFSLVDAPVNVSNIKGFVFFDTDKNGIYKMFAGDYSLAGITVELYKAGVLTATARTDSYGLYSFSGVAYGDYTVKVIPPYDFAVCTTGNLTQTVTANTPTYTTAADVGFVYTKADKAITVCKLWTVSRDADASQPDNITVRVTGKNGAAVEYTKSAVLSSINGWQATFADLPKYAADGVTILVYSVTEDAVPGYVQTGMTALSTASNITYTITNCPKGRLSLTKVDAVSPSVRVAGAQFELWEKGVSPAADTKIASLTTDSSGMIYVSGLDAGTYYFKETAAAAGYTFDPANCVTGDLTIAYTAADYLKSVTVTNTPKRFTLTKTITEASGQDEQFLFEIAGPSASTCYAVLTIPAGQMSVSQVFSDLPAGTYSVTEKNSNWRYTIHTAATVASDGTKIYAFKNGSLSMPIDYAAGSDYYFNFVDSRSNSAWVSGHSSVTNTMVNSVVTPTPTTTPTTAPTTAPTTTPTSTPTITPTSVPTVVPTTVPTSTPAPTITYVLASGITAGETYVILAKNGTAYYALTNTVSNTSYLAGTAVTVAADGNSITSGVTDKMLWTFASSGSGFTAMNQTLYLNRLGGSGSSALGTGSYSDAGHGDWLYGSGHLNTHGTNGNNYFMYFNAASAYFAQSTNYAGKNYTLFLYKKVVTP